MREPQARLLVVTTVPSTLSFLVPYADHFRAVGWRVDAVTGPGDGSAWQPHFDRLLRVSWSRRPSDPRNALRAGAQVRRLVAAGGYDIVHTHTPIASFVVRAAMATLPHRPAVVYTAHGFHFHAAGAPVTNAVFGLAEAAAGWVTDRLVVINDEDWRAAARLRTVPAARLRLFPGIGVDLGYYRATAEVADAARAMRQRIGVPADARLLSIVAEFTPRKDHRTALQALAAHADPGLHLCLAGEGPLRGAVEEEARSLGVGDRVHFLGGVRDVRPLMCASSATVLPSRREGLSRAVLESLALGVPVIGARTRGIADLLADGGGIVVEPGDVAGFARAYDDIGSHPRGAALRDQIAPTLATYSTDRLISLHEQLYDELLAAGRAVRGRATG
jgi:glycosyltransferase involved in cell wall biosynthesis